MVCECVICNDCYGQGKIGIPGLDDVDYCETCHGSGLAFICGWCSDEEYPLTGAL